HPVKSETSRTAIPASRRRRAVPPVETISMPSAASCRANSVSPLLSYTLTNARSTGTNSSGDHQQNGYCKRDGRNREEGSRQLPYLRRYRIGKKINFRSRFH